jgi:hypothetical protein
VSTAPKMKPAKAGRERIGPVLAWPDNVALLLAKRSDHGETIFLQALLADEVHRRAFQDLCHKGVPSSLLESYLVTIGWSAHRRRANSWNIFKDEKKGLPNELTRLADMVEGANNSAFGPSKWTKEPYNKIYGALPNILRLYAATYQHTERLADPLRRRRLTGARSLTIELVAIVKRFAGEPNYERVSILLTRAFDFVGTLTPSGNGKLPPKFFDAGVLAKLFRSYANFLPDDFPQGNSGLR